MPSQPVPVNPGIQQTVSASVKGSALAPVSMLLRASPAAPAACCRGTSGQGNAALATATGLRPPPACCNKMSWSQEKDVKKIQEPVPGGLQQSARHRSHPRCGAAATEGSQCLSRPPVPQPSGNRSLHLGGCEAAGRGQPSA